MVGVGIYVLDEPSANLDSEGTEQLRLVLKSLKEKVNDYLCVAGGICADNIIPLRNIGAKMLDINSSIESKIGKKDSQKLQTLLHLYFSS